MNGATLTVGSKEGKERRDGNHHSRNPGSKDGELRCHDETSAPFRILSRDVSHLHQSKRKPHHCQCAAVRRQGANDRSK
jgi:hypothetical protein